MTYKEFIEEGKNIGIIYHFTRFNNMIKLLKGNKELNLEILEFISYNGYISCSRNFAMSDDIFNNDFPLSSYNIRIAIDGTKLSNKYKIKPISGLIDNDGDIFDHNNNFKRVKRETGKSEEVLLAKKINLKDYIKEIQIYNFHNERDIDYKNKIEYLLKQNNLNIPVNLVRKFKPLKEDVYYSDTKYNIIL